jgi:ABC-type multidrug transport system ATPase subunit
MSRLHIDSLTKSYDNKVILSDIYLTCKKGEIKGLIGRNGSGKTTLLKIVFGTENAESKFVRIGEKLIRNVSEGRNLINYLPQDNFLPNNLKISTLIKLFLSKESWDTLLKNEYLAPLLNKQNQDLSGGEKRILEILLIVHSNAEYILLDEPFNGVSPILRDYIIGYIKKLRSEKGFIITDHDYENIINIADSVLYLQNGYLKEINDNRELVELGYLTEAKYNAVFNKNI